eukprot:2066092-Rhodomonas_salina.1
MARTNSTALLIKAALCLAFLSAQGQYGQCRHRGSSAALNGGSPAASILATPCCAANTCEEKKGKKKKKKSQDNTCTPHANIQGRGRKKKRRERWLEKGEGSRSRTGSDILAAAKSTLARRAFSLSCSLLPPSLPRHSLPRCDEGAAKGRRAKGRSEGTQSEEAQRIDATKRCNKAPQ